MIRRRPSRQGTTYTGLDFYHRFITCISIWINLIESTHDKILQIYLQYIESAYYYQKGSYCMMNAEW